jgi:CBS domain-containing protein
MVTRPAAHTPATTVGELRAFFDDGHVHVALLVDEGELIGTVERSDLARELDDRAPARSIAHLDGRTIAPDADLGAARTAMREGGRRRLAVTTGDARLLGLLCLKETGLGFCSDSDVESRRSR